VIQRLCPRCRSVLQLEDDTSLVFCWNCGAPQVRLSEELREIAERQIAGEPPPGSATAPAAADPPLPPAQSLWRGAIQCAALAGAVTAALALLSYVLPPIALLSLFWFVAAPIVALGVYATRFGQARITTSFGARLGILCGLSITLATAALSTLHLLLQRFVFHSTTELDTQINVIFTQLRANTEAQSGAASAPFLNLLSLPEFRVGLLLSSLAVFVAMYLAYSALAGSFAGYLRSRSNLR
jgi:hypothetical protein